MVTKITNQKVAIGLCLPRLLLERIDQQRGDIARSKYVSRILEGRLVYISKVEENRKSPGRHQDKALQSPAFPPTTLLEVDAANG